MAFAFCARDRLRVDGVFAGPAIQLLLIFLLLVLGPMATYLYAIHPSWTWMYLLNPETVPGFAILPLIVLHLGAVVVGWYIGGKLISAQRQIWLAYLGAGGLLCTATGVILTWNRLGFYGSYTEFHDGRALALMEVKLGYVLVALATGTIISSAYLAVELLRDSRRVRSR